MGWWFSHWLQVRRYQYQQRDESDNIYRYAEEYYEDEPNYVYYDYGNLDVHTIA